MTPDFLAELESHHRKYLGNAYGVYHQQQVSTDPEVFFYIQCRESDEKQWSPLTDTFDKDSLPLLVAWKMISEDAAEGWQFRIIKTEVSIPVTDSEPVETKPLAMAGAGSTADTE